MYVHVSEVEVHGNQRQKRVSDALELESHVVLTPLISGR